jgi:predicted DNA-binding transcriptional regulator AlpA
LDYIEKLRAELAAELSRQRVIGIAEGAAILNLSVPHTRRLYRTGKLPKPIKIGARKLGWQAGVLLDALAKLTSEAE